MDSYKHMQMILHQKCRHTISSKKNVKIKIHSGSYKSMLGQVYKNHFCFLRATHKNIVDEAGV